MKRLASKTTFSYVLGGKTKKNNTPKRPPTCYRTAKSFIFDLNAVYNFQICVTKFLSRLVLTAIQYVDQEFSFSN